MSADVVARIRAAIAEMRQYAEAVRVCDWAEDVLDRHTQHHASCRYCWTVAPSQWPCPDFRAMATAILGEGWDRDG